MSGIALLGNGLKSVVTSTVLVSEARFASFLGVEVERVALLMEAIVAGMVVALACIRSCRGGWPCEMQHAALRSSAHWRFAAFAARRAATARAGTREAMGVRDASRSEARRSCGSHRARKASCSAWPGRRRPQGADLDVDRRDAGRLSSRRRSSPSGCYPGWACPRTSHRLRSFRSSFAALVATTAIAARPSDGDDALPVHLVVAFATAVIMFEAWSTAGSVLGYTAAATLATLPLLAAAIAWLVKRARQFATSTSGSRVHMVYRSLRCSRWRFPRPDSSRPRFCTIAACPKRWSPIAPRSPQPPRSPARSRPASCCIGSDRAAPRRVDRVRARPRSASAATPRIRRCTPPGITWRRRLSRAWASAR